MTKRLAIGAVCVALFAGAVRAQDVERVRTLYISAAYEEALAAIPSTTNSVNPDLEQYRALCLLALGREQEAVATIERLVRQKPSYLPPKEQSPRILTLFDQVRSKVVPELARDVYLQARSAYGDKDLKTARAGFERTLALLESLPASVQSNQADLRLLASEFLELSAERPAAPPPIAAVPELADPPRPHVPVYVGPVTVHEVLPPWNPPDAAAMRGEYSGLVRLHIDDAGRVTEATVVRVSHPAYDAAVVAAARSWTYKPATRDGQPISSQKDLQIRLVPR